MAKSPCAQRRNPKMPGSGVSDGEGATDYMLARYTRVFESGFSTPSTTSCAGPKRAGHHADGQKEVD